MPINLREIFDSLSSINYVILRDNGEILNPGLGRDIDILTNNVGGIINTLVANLSNLVEQGYEVKKTETHPHVHLDILDKNGIVLRFDILFALFSDNAIEYILSTRVKKENYFVPSPESEVFTRLTEYFEHPHKIKHLEVAKQICGNK